ncbi:MAG: hypothetical protein OSB65_17485 [Roseibacillus sp.]|nr:hypothetical protein [Roseibacillus sp.]
MRHGRIAFLILLSFGSAGAIVIEGPSSDDASRLPSTAAVARIFTPFGLTASGTLLPGGRYVLTAAHVVFCIPEDRIPNGLIEFPSCAGKPRCRWKAVYLHPKAADHRLSRIWDAALIELDNPISPDVIAGVPPTTKPARKDLMVHLAGYGHRGNGLLGDYRPPGTLALGRNFFDQGPTPELLLTLGLPQDYGPLLIHRFDPGKNEAHFAAGDSGGPGLVLDPDGRLRIASLNLGRHRGPSDHDHRLNGSFGELGLSLDASALRPWLQPFLSQHRQAPNIGN